MHIHNHICSCIFAGPESASFLLVLTQGEERAIAAASLPPSSRLLFGRLGSACLWVCSPEPTVPHCRAAGWKETAKGTIPSSSSGLWPLLFHTTDASCVLIKKKNKKKIHLLFLSKYLSSSYIPERNTPAPGILLLIQGNLLHGPLLSNLRRTLIIHYFVFLSVSLQLNALCHPAH